MFHHIVEIMLQLLSTIEYCHKRMIVHRCISSENVLIVWNNGPIIKIIDFSQTTQRDCPKPLSVPAHKQNVNFT